MKDSAKSNNDSVRIDPCRDEDYEYAGNNSVPTTKQRKNKRNNKMASVSRTFSFVFECGLGTRLLFVLGVLGSIVVGLLYPAIAFILAASFSDLANASAFALEDDNTILISGLAYRFMTLGAISFISATLQTMCFELISHHASKNFRIQWFHALLRQDSAFFDIHNEGNISGTATTVGSNAIIYRRGIGMKFAEGVESIVTFLAGIAFAFYSTWKTSLLIIALLPFISAMNMMSIQIQQRKTLYASEAYKQAAATAHSTVSSIKTVLSLNMLEEKIQQYKNATQVAYSASIYHRLREGAVVGSFLGSLMILFGTITIYGSYLLYSNVRLIGCDPTASGTDAAGCPCMPSGQNIFGSLLGIMFASRALPQITNMNELLIASRVAVHEALKAIDRKPGAAQQFIYAHPNENEKDDGNKGGITTSTNNSTPARARKTKGKRKKSIFTKTTINEEREQVLKAILPKYEINSMESTSNLMAKELVPEDTNDTLHGQDNNNHDDRYCLDNISGKIVFDDVHFYYPMRPNRPILQGLSLDIEAGKTIALVGPSGGGKSTILTLIERFYDVTSGNVTIDGMNVKKFNVSFLRKNLIGYVNQEPTLFSTTIYKNIKYGNLNATREQIEFAAKMANAHDFICNLPNGYDTFVGDKGSQLSGGQKQRIAIARVLVGNPKILLLDEATSALDCESELVVQNALDNIFLNQKKKITTIIVAHRLSTIRKADMIAVIVDGKIVEKGTHVELMNIKTGRTGYYRQLVNKQEEPSPVKSDTTTATTRTVTSTANTTTNTNNINTTYTPDQQQQQRQQQQQQLNETEINTVQPSSKSKTISKEATSILSSPLSHSENITLSNNDVIINTSSLLDDEYSSSHDRHHISFKNVRFAFPTRPNRNVLDKFNLSINHGETLALVGPSGGGKSTIVNLIERFYDPEDGCVEYDGYDIKSLNVQWFRDQIGYVGQEPALFNDSIEKNIAHGVRRVLSKEEIVEAAKQANAHEFIKSFPEGYKTHVGESGAQLSGGQKQRVAIARALVKKPKVLILDEATSALDNDSEAIVQAALDKLMESRDRTTVVIAHRLSTVRNVDRIAFVSNGKVVESGAHDELLARKNGRFKRLLEAQKRLTTVESVGLLALTTTEVSSSTEDKNEKKDDVATAEIEDDASTQTEKDSRKKAFSLSRARKMAAPDIGYLILGGIGALGVGGTYPAWGILFGNMISLLFVRVMYCDDNIIHDVTSTLHHNEYNVSDAGRASHPPTSILSEYEVCEHYWSSVADDMRDKSYWATGYWFILAVSCVFFHILMFQGFSTASERLNKRVRDQAFTALVRQEVGFFDMQSVGKITSQLQDDAAQIHAFTGEPVRSFLIACSSFCVGILASFIFMWPFALVLMLTMPLMAFSSKVRFQSTLGDSSLFKDDGKDEESNSPGGIAVETLLNMRTVSTLGLEWEKYENYKDAILQENANYVYDSFTLGVRTGLGLSIRQWCQGLQFFWAFTGISDRKEVEECAGRIFYLLDRKSQIDPLSEEGVKLD